MQKWHNKFKEKLRLSNADLQLIGEYINVSK